jgi:hypothetical protein
MTRSFKLGVFAAAALTLHTATVFACSSCGCTLGSEWADEGYSAAPGLRVDLRYDFINQDQLRHGGSKASDADIASTLASGSAEETQQQTLTRFYTLGLDYGIGRDWGINVQLPYLDRTHGTIADGEDAVTSSDKSGIGDIRVVGRYQGLFEDRSLGLQLGVKLPTGEYKQNFASGPDAGELLDRGLQLGTGTTDVIAGIYHFASFNRDWDHFEQAQFKAALASRDDFRPGNQWSASVGVRYMAWSALIPQLQLNFKNESKESGVEADRPNSGSRELYLSPGLSWLATKSLSAYGFVQLPIFSDYDGLQLAPHYIVSTGLHYSF